MGCLPSKVLRIISNSGRKRSKIDGEERLLGLGVSYCAICDGSLFKGRRVAVIGYGDEAVEDVLLLSGMASRTYFIPPPSNRYE